MNLSRTSEIQPTEDEEAAMAPQRLRGSTVTVIREQQHSASASPARPRPVSPRMGGTTGVALPHTAQTGKTAAALPDLKSVAMLQRKITRIWQVVLLDARLMYCIAKSAGQDSAQMTALFLKVADALGYALPFCRKMILFEFLEHMRPNDQSSIMRGNSVATRIGTAMGRKRSGLIWVVLVLRDAVARATAPGVVLELDGSEERALLVQRLCSLILERIEEHLDVLPLEVRAVCGFILAATCKYTPDLGYRLVGGYLLLRLVNPVILDPSLAPGLLSTGLGQGAAAAAAQRNLIVLANVMQHLSNGGSPFKKDSELCMNRWLVTMKPVLERLFERVCRDPDCPMGMSPWERFRTQKLHDGNNAGKTAAQVLSVEEAEFANRVFASTRAEVVAKLKRFDVLQSQSRRENPRMSMLLKSTGLTLRKKETVARGSILADLQLTDVFFTRLDELMKEEERSAPVPQPDLLANAWLVQVSKLKLLHKVSMRQQHWRHDPHTRLLHGYRHETSAAPEDTIDLSRVFAVYARVDLTAPRSLGPTLLDVHTPDRTFVFSFRDNPAALHVWLTGLNSWSRFLRPELRAYLDRKPLQGYLKKRGNRGPEVLRAFKTRWFHQINHRIYYFEDVMSNSLGFIDLSSLAWIDFPDTPTEGKWIFRVRQKKHTSAAIAEESGAAGSPMHELLMGAASQHDDDDNGDDDDDVVNGRKDGPGAHGADNVDDDDDDDEDDGGDEHSARMWVLQADSHETFEYWREGFSLFCTRGPSDAQRQKSALQAEPVARAQSASLSFADLSLSSQRLDDLHSKQFRDYMEAPTPQLVNVLRWLADWLAAHPNELAPGPLLFGVDGAASVRRNSDVAAVIADLCDGIAVEPTTPASHVGGALLYILSMPSVPVVPEHQVAQLLQVADIVDASGRLASLHAVICGLPWQHREVLRALVKWIAAAGGSVRARQDSLIASLVPTVLGVGSASAVEVRDLFRMLVDHADHAFNESGVYGEWTVHPTLGTMMLAAAPLATIIALLSNPFVADVDADGVRAVLMCHQTVTTAASMLGAFAEFYKMYGGGVRRSATWRRDLAHKSGDWPEMKLRAVASLLRHWCMLDNSLALLAVSFVHDTFFTGVSYNPTLDAIIVDFASAPADLYAFEHELLLFLSVWKSLQQQQLQLQLQTQTLHAQQQQQAQQTLGALAESGEQSLMMDHVDLQDSGIMPRGLIDRSPRTRNAAAQSPGVGSLRWQAPQGTSMARSPRSRLPNAPPLEEAEDDGGESAQVVGRIRLGSRKSPLAQRHLQSAHSAAQPPLPVVVAAASASTHPEDIALWKVAPLSLATALASADAELLRAVRLDELAYGRWRARETAPRLWAYSDRETWYRDWCLGWVLRYQNSDDQAVVVVFLVKLATQLRFVKSYLGSKAVVRALTHACLTPLKRLWALVPDDYRARLAALQRFYDSALYERELEQRSLPVLPVASDLIAALDGTDAYPTTVTSTYSGGREWINVTKMRTMSVLVHAVTRFQKSAMPCAYDTDANIVELVRRHAPLVMAEAEAIKAARALEK